MDTREFEKKLITKERLAELINSAKERAEKEKLDISEEKTEKYAMKTLRKNKRPLAKWYRYKSWTGYFHDFVGKINYQYIPA